jgi:multidrug/hemolysin transport system permease protein
MNGEWKTTSCLIKRNVKMFFKDKGTFFTSLITPIILLVLYVTFLYGIYKSSFKDAFGGFPIEEELLNGLVGGLLLSSLLAVSTVTVSFCSNLCMVADKVSGARSDFTVSPVSNRSLALGYYVSTAINALIISYAATLVGFVYLAFTGWYMSVLDVLALFLDVLLLVLFGTALSSIVCYPLTSQGQLSAVGTIVSAGYGFVCGAYMPISQFSEGLRNAVAFLPGTYGTSLLRNHALRGAFAEMEAQGLPAALIDCFRDSVDCNLYFFDRLIPQWVMYTVVGVGALLLMSAYVLIHLRSNRTK